MSILDKIIELYTTPEFRYKGIPVNCFGLPTFTPHKRQSVTNAFSKLKKEGAVLKKDGAWFLSEAGTKKKKSDRVQLKQFSFQVKKGVSKNLIVMFDITEPKKRHRDWFRFYLRELGFEMVQRSVWLGPSPLPKEFLEYLKEIGLKDSIRMFKVSSFGVM